MRSNPGMALVGLAVTAIPGAAFAHTGVGDAHGLGHGFMHPLGGLDHVLAMVAVGLLAASLGGRALWLVPASFVVMMAVGGLLAINGLGVPFVELGIAASVVVLGLAVALQSNFPTSVAAGLAGFFAIFHGHAHGVEMPADASGLAYGFGFMAATALLHAVGVALASLFGRTGAGWARVALRAGGGGMALAGVAILAGLV